MNPKIVIMAIALTLPLTVSAFPGGKAEDHAAFRAQRVERLTEELNLNAEQKTQVEQIFQQQRDKQEALRQETHQRLQAVLSPEQMSRFEALKQERQAKWQKHRAGKGQPHPHSDTPAP